LIDGGARVVHSASQGGGIFATLGRMRRDRSAIPRVLSVRRAGQFGISRSAIRHARTTQGWQMLARGIVLTAPGPPTRDDWTLVGLEIAGPRAALSGWDALRIRGLGAGTPPTPRVLILDRGGTNHALPGVLIRPTPRPYATQLLPAEHPTLAFAPVVPVARALADTALDHRRLDPVRAMVTSAVQRGLCRPDQLVAELEAGPRNRSALLRRALADVLNGAQSIAEAEAADVLRQARVADFELNVPIVDRTGTVVAVADALWRQLRAVAEIDSREFHFSEQDWKATMRRHNRLTAAGIAVAHYPPSDIRARRTAWARDVESWLRSRAIELGVPYQRGSGGRRAPGSAPEPFVIT
jgi:hypothetical protein